MSEGNYRKTGFSLLAILLIMLAVFCFIASFPKGHSKAEMDRARVAATKWNMLDLEKAIQTYSLENDFTPPVTLHGLTSPVAYIYHLPVDHFNKPERLSYWNTSYGAPESKKSICILWGAGPDKEYDISASLISEYFENKKSLSDIYSSTDPITTLLADKTYDASNGAESRGDIIRIFAISPHY